MNPKAKALTSKIKVPTIKGTVPVGNNMQRLGTYPKLGAKAVNPNSPANYGPAMASAFKNTKTFGMPSAQ